VIDRVRNEQPPDECTGRFVYLAGELTARAHEMTAGQPLSLTAIVQTIQDPATAPTGSILIVEGGQEVARAPYAGRLTSVTVADVSSGTHHYAAHYSGDATYAPLDFGAFRVNASEYRGA
jgi:hypothetical protein